MIWDVVSVVVLVNGCGLAIYIWCLLELLLRVLGLSYGVVFVYMLVWGCDIYFIALCLHVCTVGLFVFLLCFTGVWFRLFVLTLLLF